MLEFGVMFCRLRMVKLHVNGLIAGEIITMQTRHIITLIGANLLMLAGCQNTPPTIPVPQASMTLPKAEVGEITRKAAKEYSACVWSNAEKMRLGSPDVRLVVETATNTCKMSIQRLQSALAIDKTESVFAKSYLDTIIENAKTEAMVLVLKGNAKDARIRAAKQE